MAIFDEAYERRLADAKAQAQGRAPTAQVDALRATQQIRVIFPNQQDLDKAKLPPELFGLSVLAYVSGVTRQ